MDECPDCGAPLGDREACHAAWHLLGVRAMQEGVVRTRAMHDAWCLQHPEPYTRSLKSFYVHFLGLAVAIVEPADPRAQAAIWDDIRVPAGIDRPAVPERMPAVTAAEVIRAPDVATGDRFVRAEWDRWSHAHDIAHEWLDEASRARRRRR